MAMGRRQHRERQEDLWVAHRELATAPGHPFYERLNAVLDAEGFDRFVEDLCAKFYAPQFGRPSLTPGIYFRSLLIGYFEGIGAERGIAWRLADSLALRRFVGIALDEETPDHSTISRTRRLIDLDTHAAVFAWVLEVLARRGLIVGKRVAIDATTLEANAAMRSIVRRDTGASYEEFLTGLAKASGIETPTREDLARLDRKRKKRTSNKEWKSPVDEDARVAKMKDGRTHLAHKAEHAVDLDSGAVVAVTLQAADKGDTATMDETLIEAGMAVAELAVHRSESHSGDTKVNLHGIEELVADKGYLSGAVLKRVKTAGLLITRRWGRSRPATPAWWKAGRQAGAGVRDAGCRWDEGGDESARAQKAQREAFDRILGNHLLYCTVCDNNNGNCTVHNTTKLLAVEHQEIPVPAEAVRSRHVQSLLPLRSGPVHPVRALRGSVPERAGERDAEHPMGG
jgi:transposase